MDEKSYQTGNFTAEAASPAFQKRIPSDSASSVHGIRAHNKET